MAGFTAHDRTVLRDLAALVNEIGRLPVQAERIGLWKAHNSLRPCRPMILIFPEGSWGELLPPQALRCEEPRAREIERSLLMRVYQHEHFDADNVITPVWQVGKAIRHAGWGLEPLELNNDDTYHNSGGNGWTAELPRHGFDGMHVAPRHMSRLSRGQGISTQPAATTQAGEAAAAAGESPSGISETRRTARIGWTRYIEDERDEKASAG